MREPRVTEHEVDALLEQFNGNARATIRALMHDLALVTQVCDEEVSRGFMRREKRMAVHWGSGTQGGPEVG